MHIFHKHYFKEKDLKNHNGKEYVHSPLIPTVSPVVLGAFAIAGSGSVSFALPVVPVISVTIDDKFILQRQLGASTFTSHLLSTR